MPGSAGWTRSTTESRLTSKILEATQETEEPTSSSARFHAINSTAFNVRNCTMVSTELKHEHQEASSHKWVKLRRRQHMSGGDEQMLGLGILTAFWVFQDKTLEWALTHVWFLIMTLGEKVWGPGISLKTIWLSLASARYPISQPLITQYTEKLCAGQVPVELEFDPRGESSIFGIITHTFFQVWNKTSVPRTGLGIPRWLCFVLDFFLIPTITKLAYIETRMVERKIISLFSKLYSCFPLEWKFLLPSPYSSQFAVLGLHIPGPSHVSLLIWRNHLKPVSRFKVGTYVNWRLLIPPLSHI